jgi:hypothetical protein
MVIYDIFQSVSHSTSLISVIRKKFRQRVLESGFTSEQKKKENRLLLFLARMIPTVTDSEKKEKPLRTRNIR